MPLGVAAALYLSEYAPDNWFTRHINLCIINLAGVPSIVHALFGVGAFVIFFGFGTSILAASLTLGIMTLPVVIVATRESLQAVPLAFREACWNMGATRWQTIQRVVLPNAVSGILTGVILEVSRTTGETAPIMFTGAAFFLPFLPQGIFDQTMALSLHLFVVSTQVPGVPDALPYGVALVLIGMVLLMNSLSIALRIYMRGTGRNGDGGSRAARGDRGTSPRRYPRTTSAACPRRSWRCRTSPSATAAMSLSAASPSRYASTRSWASSGRPTPGKTSFLKVLNRMDLFDSAMQFDGTIRFDGVDTRQVAERLRAAQANRRRVSAARRPAAHRVRQRRACPPPRRPAELALIST